MCQIFNYFAFKLYIKSCIKLPELIKHNAPEKSSPDAIIQYGQVSAAGLPDALHRGAFYQANEQSLWLDVPEVARYLISNGNTISIEPYQGADDASIRVFLLGSCMGALLMQRRLFLLHANAIKVKGHCVAFAGHSGAGKSTLAGAFSKHGYAVLADDVCAIDHTGHVIPSFPQIKLWADASHKLAINTEGLKRIRPDIKKFALPLEASFHPEPLPLRVLYILNSHNQDTFKFEQIKGMQKMLPLQNNTYRQQYLKGLGKTREHLKQAGQIASQVEIVRITRPQTGFQLDKLMTLIQEDLLARGVA